MTGCAVISLNEKFAIDSIKRLYDENKNHAKIIVAGCISKIASEKISMISNEIIQIPNDEISRLDDFFYNEEKINDVDFNINPKRHHSYGDPLIIVDEEEVKDQEFVETMSKFIENNNVINQHNYSTRGKHLWKEDDLFEIKVASGCTGNCSYCATKLAIGDFKSVSEKRIINQAIEAKKLGYKRIMLIGDEIGAWHENNRNIVDLINSILNIDSTFKIGIRYIQPDIIVKYYEQFKPLFKMGSIYYFCSAFQSGSERILKLMNRNSNIDPFIKCMEDIEKNNYPVYKHTQIIVGFPTENELDVLKTLKALQRVSFDYVTISSYSKRKGTEAYKLESLSEKEINYRMEIFDDWLKLNRRNKIYKSIRNVTNTLNKIKVKRF